MDITGRLLNIAATVLIYLLSVQFLNYFSLKKLGRFPGAADYPFVSVLVPARNEERNIEKCIQSLLAQDYPDYELLVLDDESEDQTWPLLSRLAEGKADFHLLKGKPLPEGWVGKCWACHQLAEKARGEYLLFVDADTVHQPSMLRSVIDAAHYYRADLISGLPQEKVETLSELLTVPLITWGIFAALPLPLAFAHPSPVLSITIGQLLLFKREAYDRIGGHQAVKDHVCEDMALGRLMKARGFRWRLVDAGAVTGCRMYTGLRDAVNGLSKTIYGALNFRIGVVFLFSLLLGLMFCLPPWVLLKSLAVPLPRALVRQAVTTTALAFLSWAIAGLRFRMPLSTAIHYPLISVLAIFIFLRSAYQTVTGKAHWKGRLLARRKLSW